MNASNLPPAAFYQQTANCCVRNANCVSALRVAITNAIGNANILVKTRGYVTDSVHYDEQIVAKKMMLAENLANAPNEVIVQFLLEILKNDFSVNHARLGELMQFADIANKHIMQQKNMFLMVPTPLTNPTVMQQQQPVVPPVSIFVDYDADTAFGVSMFPQPHQQYHPKQALPERAIVFCLYRENTRMDWKKFDPLKGAQLAAMSKHAHGNCVLVILASMNAYLPSEADIVNHVPTAVNGQHKMVIIAKWKMVAANDDEMNENVVMDVEAVKKKIQEAIALVK